MKNKICNCKEFIETWHLLEDVTCQVIRNKRYLFEAIFLKRLTDAVPSLCNGYFSKYLPEYLLKKLRIEPSFANDLGNVYSEMSQLHSELSEYLESQNIDFSNLQGVPFRTITLRGVQYLTPDHFFGFLSTQCAIDLPSGTSEKYRRGDIYMDRLLRVAVFQIGRKFILFHEGDCNFTIERLFTKCAKIKICMDEKNNICADEIKVLCKEYTEENKRKTIDNIIFYFIRDIDEIYGK